MQKYYNSPEVELLYSVKIVSTYLSLSQLFCISLFVRFFNLKKSNGKDNISNFRSFRKLIIKKFLFILS